MIKFSNIILVLLLCFSLSAAHAEQMPETSETVEVAILDSRQNPIAGALLELTPLAGELQGAIMPTNAQGRTTFNWLPQVVQDESNSTDLLYRYIASFAWKVEKTGYLPESGIVGHLTTQRQIESEELPTLNAMPAFPPIQQSINLYQPGELFAAEFNYPELKSWCESFYNKNYQLTRALGTAFQWPAFAMENEQTLVIKLQYTDTGWAGASDAALLHKATLNTYLPWCLLLSEQLSTLPLLQNIKLEYVSSQDINPLDPHAWSENIVLSAVIPVQALSQIGLGDSLSQMAASYPLRSNTDSPPLAVSQSSFD